MYKKSKKIVLKISKLLLLTFTFSIMSSALLDFKKAEAANNTIKVELKKVNGYTNLTSKKRVRRDDGVYVNYTTYTNYQNKFEYLTMNGVPVFCVEPWAQVKNNSNYYIDNDLGKVLENNIYLKNEIELITYYGWNTSDKTMEDYAATQLLIWETMSKYNIFNLTWNNIPEFYKDKKESIVEKINKSKKTPSFNNQKINIKLGETRTLIDKNNVLYDFMKAQGYKPNTDIEKDGLILNYGTYDGNQYLKIKATENTKNSTILSFENIPKENIGSNIVYISSNSQKVSPLNLVNNANLFNLTINMKQGTLEFTKVDMSTSKPVAGATIEFYHEGSNKPFLTGITDANGLISKQGATGETDRITDNRKIVLEEGNYYYKETKAPEGYKINTDKHAFIITAGKITKDTLKNEKETKGTLEFTKVDLSTSKPLAGATIEFYHEGSNKPFLTGITDANGLINKNSATGEIDRITDNGKIVLEEGNYYYKETKAPEGYKINTDKHAFIITAGKITKDTLKNEKETKGTLEFTKVDMSTSKPVAGATIEFYHEGSNKPFLTGITDANGLISKNGATGEIDRITDNGKIVLEEGNYYYKETKAPEGYKINTDKHNFVITAGRVTKDTLKNEKETKGTLEFTKVDMSTSKPVAGATIEFYHEGSNKPFLIGITDANGLISKNGATGETDRITNDGKIVLEEGNYYYKETKAPEGYKINTDKHTFIITAGKITKDTLKNEKETKETKIVNKKKPDNKNEKGKDKNILPKTGYNNDINLYIGLMSLFGGLFIFKKKRKIS
ncbi:SpaA isopeptide-forming pilin-related protein [Clostridium baratii]|uniref:SpaA isopeptide-forming pilin-related protein n=1 Tax=Clostridium baratii TaxID=1561 RepID=UPI0030CD2058